jgi:hypothetical protein
MSVNLVVQMVVLEGEVSRRLAEPPAISLLAVR